MESLRPVCGLLIYRKRQDLADLLGEAGIKFEYVDMGFSLHSDSVTDMVNAVVYAPMSTYDQLLALSSEDNELIWIAIQDVWPNVEGEQAVIGCSFRLWAKSSTITDYRDEFLSKEFEIPSFDKLPVPTRISTIIQERLDEAQLCLSKGAYLSVIFLSGSILEAVLLGAAENDPKAFNESKFSPKDNGKVKRFSEWHLAEFIDSAHDIGLLERDIKVFSHQLRNFRNYIHPHKQIESGFKPDEHTATICFQVLKAALASISGDR